MTQSHVFGRCFVSFVYFSFSDTCGIEYCIMSQPENRGISDCLKRLGSKFQHNALKKA